MHQQATPARTTQQQSEAYLMLRQRTDTPIASFALGALEGQVLAGEGSLWVVLRKGELGGLALRMPLFGADAYCIAVPEDDGRISIRAKGGVGATTLELTPDLFGLERLRATMRFTPRQAFQLHTLPRDIMPFDWAGDPQATDGDVEARQRKLNTGLVYFTMDRPELGKVLYVQNLTALNAYFNATGTKPENVVGGDWPELGYCPPLAPEGKPTILPAGEEMVLYDTILVIRGYPQHSEEDSAWQFLDMLGAAYEWLDHPVPTYRDWPDRARRTVKDLETAPEARIEHYGTHYFHPYTASEYPDVMVQLSIGSALNDWERWSGEPQTLLTEIMEGLHRFYDTDLQTLRRYLPNVGKDKDANAVDSWYLYHPMLNLANLALTGHDKARELFLASIDYGIRVAHHFGYQWPILFDMRDFKVIRAVAEADERGQTDVGGIYAWVMLQAFEMTHERRFLDEAQAAIKAARGMRFELNYQANLTAWGASACIRLWRVTNDKHYLTQSYVYLASFFHNCQIWESDIGLARYWRNFLGVTCLQDAPYMAAYECFDSYAALERYLDYGGPDLIPSVRRLVGDYCRHALDRAWFYYPDALPGEALATENRNGYIKRDLSFPLEDLYPDGQKAGQVGQEIYGSGAAIVFASHAFHRLDGAPFVLHTNVLARAIHRLDGHTISVRLDGDERVLARVALVPDGERQLSASILLANGRICPVEPVEDRFEAIVPANAAFLLRWKEEGSDSAPNPVRTLPPGPIGVAQDALENLVRRIARDHDKRWGGEWIYNLNTFLYVVKTIGAAPFIFGMTAYDPTLVPSRPGLLERLGLRNRAAAEEAPPETQPVSVTFAQVNSVEQTLDRIGQFLQLHKLELSPFTLATAYEYVTGENQRLRREVETRIANVEPITIAWLKSIAETETEEVVDQFDKIFELLEDNISQFSDTTQTAQRATREYGAVLESHAAELKKSDEGQRQLIQVATVVAAMVQRTKKLEDQLQESQKQANVLKKSLDDVQQKANQDHLTGLPNRRAFERMYEEEVIAAQAEIEPLCVAFCDIDHFKMVNDTHGHEAGDRVLKVIARKLASISDDKCHVARHGGEEFVMLFRGSPLSQAVAMLDTLRDEMSDRRLINRKTDQPIGRVTFSAGVADVFAYETPRAALAAADAALYEAKQQGRNRVLAAATAG